MSKYLYSLNSHQADSVDGLSMVVCFIIFGCNVTGFWKLKIWLPHGMLRHMLSQIIATNSGT